MQLLPGEEPARVGPQPPPVDQRPSHWESGQIDVLADAEVGKETQLLVNDGDPRSLRQRPRWRGLPVPFTTLMGPDGVPDFRSVDGGSRERCLVQRLCGLCGEKLKGNETNQSKQFSIIRFVEAI